MLATLKDDAIPQATMEAVRAVVDACAHGASDRAAAAEATGISPRHVAYAVSAAVALGLVRAARDALELTLLGQSLASATPGTEDERRILVQGASGSGLLRRLAPGLAGDTPPELTTVTDNIRRHGGLSEATAVHRARMILGWRKRLVTASQGRARRRSGPRAQDSAEPARAARRKPHEKGVWRRLELRNFRSFERAEVVLAPFTLLVGASGSGKSNLVDALLFMRDVAQSASDAIEQRGGISRVRRWTAGPPPGITLDLRAARRRDELETDYARHELKLRSTMSGVWRFASERVEVTKRAACDALLERDRDRVSRIGDAALPGVTDTSSAVTIARQLKVFSPVALLHGTRRYALNCDSMRCASMDNGRLDGDGGNLAAAVLSLGDGDERQALERAMAELLPGLEGISAEPNGRALVLTCRRRVGDAIVDLDASQLPDGSLRALGMLTACLESGPDELIIIEESALGLGRQGAGALLAALDAAPRRGSLLLVTHDPELVAAGLEREILVCRSIEGSTRITPLGEEDRRALAEGTRSLAEVVDRA